MTTAEVASDPLPLPEPARWFLWLLFGASTVGVLQEIAPELPPLDRLLIALSSSLLITSLGWFFVLALRRGTLWTLAMLVPYVNVIAVSWFARRYWRAGARAPTLLLLGASLLQLVVLARWLIDPAGPVLV